MVHRENLPPILFWFNFIKLSWALYRRKKMLREQKKINISRSDINNNSPVQLAIKLLTISIKLLYTLTQSDKKKIIYNIYMIHSHKQCKKDFGLLSVKHSLNMYLWVIKKILRIFNEFIYSYCNRFLCWNPR